MIPNSKIIRNINKYLHLSSLLVMLLFLSANGVSQSIVWAKSMGANYDEQGTMISKPVLDFQHNLYITGAFNGTVDFDPGPDEFILTSEGSDIFVAKYNSDGDFVWANSVNYGKDDMGGGIAVNEAGEVFIHNYDGEIIKFNTNGQIAWQKEIIGAMFSYYNIDFDNNGDLIITGGFSETVDADPGTGTYYLHPEGTLDLFIIKLDDAGNFKWAKSIGGNGAYIDGLGHIADDSIYINGYFSGTIDFDPGANTFIMNASKENYILKLDLAGNFVNAFGLIEANNSYFDGINSTCIDSEGNIYSVGAFSGTVDFDPGAGTKLIESSGDLNGFIQKVSPDGKLIWAEPISNIYDQYAWFVDIDNENYIYVTGIGSFSDTTLLTESGDSTGLFIIKVTPTGKFDWVKTLGYSFGASVVDDNTGDIYTAGWFDRTIHINSENVNSLVAIGSSDIFIQKIIQPSFTSENPVSVVSNIAYLTNIITFPNPSVGYFKVEINEQVFTLVKIEVFDLAGKLVYSKAFEKDQVFNVDISLFKRGIYNINIKYNGYQVNKKIVLQ